jgi:hypothetical protein
MPMRLVGALNRFGQGSFRLEPPDPATFRPGEPRHVNIGALARWILGDLPGLERISLSWTVVAVDVKAPGPSGGWGVIASDPQHLDAVARALAETAPVGPTAAGWANCGTADGRRLARQLGTWRHQAGLLAPAPDLQALEDALTLMAELANGVDRCRWRMCRPSAERVHLEADLQLSPPESAGPTD